jgi:hypothetical protein
MEGPNDNRFGAAIHTFLPTASIQNRAEELSDYQPTPAHEPFRDFQFTFP